HGGAKPLPPAPVKELLRGSLPVIAADGRQPWQIYARPFNGPAEWPRVAVIVTDLGLDRAATEAAIARLPAEVTLAFSPYAGGLDKWVKKARDAGHEVLLMLPVEPAGFPARDPGPQALLASSSAEEVQTRLEAVLGRATGYTGVVAVGGRLAGSSQLGQAFIALRERGLLYIGDGVLSGAKVPAAASITAVADQDGFRDAIDARLGQVLATVRLQNRAVVTVSARPASLERLAAWLTRLPQEQVSAAPASAVARMAEGK
ncbi:MAG: divergent polysaccharide deacetylase family protein, partial [Magnetospirillum sp.]|nr:divergent polysaccharide deacetylase family protein [Magnetospirillum sp.]